MSDQDVEIQSKFTGPEGAMVIPAPTTFRLWFRVDMFMVEDYLDALDSRARLCEAEGDAIPWEQLKGELEI